MGNQNTMSTIVTGLSAPVFAAVLMATKITSLHIIVDRHRKIKFNETCRVAAVNCLVNDVNSVVRTYEQYTRAENFLESTTLKMKLYHQGNTICKT